MSGDNDPLDVDGAEGPSDGRVGSPRGKGHSRVGRTLQGARKELPRYAIVLVLIALALGFSFALPDIFPTLGNLTTMLTSQGILLILALAVTFPLRAGDFDLSVASVMTFSAVVSGVLTAQGHWPSGLAMLVSLAVGVAVGLFNGALIVLVGIDAFITTLGTMTILGGLAYAVTNSSVIDGLGEGLVGFSRTQFLGLPAFVFYGWILAFLVWYVYQYTPFGRYLLFVGGNRDAANLAGISVRRVRILAFVASAVLSAIAGILIAGQLGAVDPSIAPQYLLPPYAAAFLGTTTIQVGRFNVVGTLVALYLLDVGITGLELLGAPPWISDVFNGGALVAAVVFARLAARAPRTT